MNEILLILLPTLLIGSVFSAVAGSGLGVILVIVLTWFFDVHTSIVLMALIGFVIQPAKVIHFYRFTDWHIVRWYILLGMPLSYIGGNLLFTIPQRTLEVVIALTCLLFVMLRSSRWKWSLEPTRSNLMFWGAVNGLQGGLVGLGNFTRNPLMLAFGLTKERFLGTASVISVALNIGKSVAYVPNITWTSELTTILAASAIPVFLGINLGKRLHRFISDILFERLLLFVIFTGAVKLLFFS